MSRRQLVTVAGIVGLGVAAALPLHNRARRISLARSESRCSANGSAAALGHPRAPIPGHWFARSRRPSRESVHHAPGSRSQLEDNGLPPELPQRYHPLLDERPRENIPPPTPPQPPPAPRQLESASLARGRHLHPKRHARIASSMAIRWRRLQSDTGEMRTSAAPLLGVQSRCAHGTDPLPLGVTLTIGPKPGRARNRRWKNFPPP